MAQILASTESTQWKRLYEPDHGACPCHGSAEGASVSQKRALSESLRNTQLRKNVAHATDVIQANAIAW